MLVKQANSTPKQPECRWASFYLAMSLMAALSNCVGNLCPTAYCLAMTVYISGLITQTNAQTTRIAENVGILSHDQLTRMLRALGWGISSGAICAVKFIELIGISGGYLIIDDVLIPKPFAALIAFCGWDWDHSRHYNVFGQRLVFVVWCNGNLIIPLLFAFWQKDTTKPRKHKKRARGRPRKKGRPITDYCAKAKTRRQQYRRKRKVKLRRKRLPNGVHYRSKNELARVLVWKLMRAGIKCEFILFDNWYACEDNFTLFERLHLFWVTRVKENAKVYYQQQRIEVKEVGATVEKANYHYYDAISARVRSFQVLILDCIRKLTVIKDDTAPEAGRTKYLLTNAAHLTNLEHIFWYRRRWSIEVFSET
ncbi:MAG: transposase [Acidobacteriota bacterium]